MFHHGQSDVHHYNPANKKEAEAICLDGRHEGVIGHICDSLPNRSSRRRLGALLIHPVLGTKMSASVSCGTIDRDDEATQGTTPVLLRLWAGEEAQFAAVIPDPGGSCAFANIGSVIDSEVRLAS